MKRFWVKAIPWQKEIVTAAIESGAEAIMVPEDKREETQKLARVKVISANGELKLGKEVVEIEIKNKQDEERAVDLSKKHLLIVKTRDWKVIPLENLVAQSQGIIAEVEDSKEAKTVLGVLEKGVSGILLNTCDVAEVKKCSQIISTSQARLKLLPAEVKKLIPLGMGDRVCIDTCTAMGEGEGILVGNTSSGYFLVHSESIETPYVTPRPFRVNAGGIHAYTLLASGKTSYLSELKVGDEVMLVNARGETQVAIIGRVKIERRPMLLLEASAEGKSISLLLQNAETIRLTSPQGKAVSVVKLAEGDKVLAYLEEPGRHFGIKISETITEK
jgi:3-dehydroquinate synthase II